MLLASWDNYYLESVIKISNIHTRIIGVNTSSYFISGCTFTDLKSSGGGAIYMKAASDDVKMLFEDSVAINCTSTSYGGIIYYLGDKGQIVISKVCGNRCKASKYCHGQTFSTRVSKVTGSFIPYNHITMCSAVCCGSYDCINDTDITDESRYSPIEVNYGNISVDSVNVSHNVLYVYGLIYINGESSENQYIQDNNTLKFSTFDGCRLGQNGINFGNRRNTDMLYCNIMNNVVFEYVSWSPLIYTCCNSIIKHCSITGNKGGSSIMFCASGKAVVMECHVSDNDGEFSPNDNEITEKYTNPNTHLETFGCSAVFPHNKRIKCIQSCPIDRIGVIRKYNLHGVINNK